MVDIRVITCIVRRQAVTVSAFAHPGLSNISLLVFVDTSLSTDAFNPVVCILGRRRLEPVVLGRRENAKDVVSP